MQRDSDRSKPILIRIRSTRCVPSSRGSLP